MHGVVEIEIADHGGVDERRMLGRRRFVAADDTAGTAGRNRALRDAPPHRRCRAARAANGAGQAVDEMSFCLVHHRIRQIVEGESGGELGNFGDDGVHGHTRARIVVRSYPPPRLLRQGSARRA